MDEHNTIYFWIEHTRKENETGLSRTAFFIIRTFAYFLCNPRNTAHFSNPEVCINLKVL